MKTIVLFNLKGGVGKSSTVATVSHMLATIHKKRVLLVDIDPQGNSSCIFSEIDYFSLLSGKTDQKKSIQDMLLNPELDPHECIYSTNFDRLDVIPAYLTLAEAEETIKADKVIPQQFKLKNQLDKISSEYDYCLIDCSPSLSILNINALVSADEVYIPMGVDAGSIMGARSVLNLVKMVKTYHPRLKVAGAFFTRYQENKEVSKQAITIFDAIMKDITLIPITIRNNKMVEESSWVQQPLLELDPKAKGTATADYIFLTEYMLMIEKTDVISKYEKYCKAEKDLNKLRSLRNRKNKGLTINEKDLKALEKEYKNKTLTDYIDLEEM